MTNVIVRFVIKHIACSKWAQHYKTKNHSKTFTLTFHWRDDACGTRRQIEEVQEPKVQSNKNYENIERGPWSSYVQTKFSDCLLYTSRCV